MSDSKWFYFAIVLSLALFGLQYMRYLSSKEQLAQKEARMRQKMQAKADRQAKKHRDHEERHTKGGKTKENVD